MKQKACMSACQQAYLNSFQITVRGAADERAGAADAATPPRPVPLAFLALRQRCRRTT
jgi:hypothetical protein